MHGETRDTEAGGNIFVTKKRIGRDPSTQFAGKLASLFYSSFWHQYDEFVPAVARYHIGPPAILLQYVTHALQYHVAFQMSVKVVYEFEAIEIHQNQGKWTIRACGALPF